MPIILLIEDNRTIRDNTAEILELEGYTVATARDGKKGLEKIIDSTPDLIICDVFMPEMGGLELLTKLGQHRTLKTIPVIFYSARAEKEDIKKGMDLGAYDYIVKPSDLQDLLTSIQKCLKERRPS